MANRDVEEGLLGRLTPIGEGGQARVFSTENYPLSLYKQYFEPSKVRLSSLRRLIDFPTSLSANDRRYLEAHAAMPQALVVKNGVCTGFLMPAAPATFFGSMASGSRKLQELSFLLKEVKPPWATLPIPGPRGRLGIMRAALMLARVLHGHGVVLGDISMKNVLWSVEPEPQIFLLDCDGWRFSGGLAAAEVIETPDWQDPALGGEEATMDSDRYKLALLCLRLMATSIYARPEDQPVLSSEYPASFVAKVLSVVSDVSGGRPTVEELLDGLEGRERIMLGQPIRRRPRTSQLTAALRPAITLGG